MDTVNLQDELTGALIGLAKACGHNPRLETTTGILVEGLFTTITNVNFKDEVLIKMIKRVRQEREKIVPNCSKCTSVCGNTSEYDMKEIWDSDEDIRSLKSSILFGLRGIAAYAYHAMVLGYEDEAVNEFFYKALSIISYDLSIDQLLPVVLEVGEINLACMELLKSNGIWPITTPKVDL